jgi:four helix bundle protein
VENHRLRIVRFTPDSWQPNEELAWRWTNSLDDLCVKARACDFALRLTELVESLPMTGAAGICGDELLQSATLIGTNCEAPFDVSPDERRHKLGIVKAETRECWFWLDLLLDAEVAKGSNVIELMEEAERLVAIVSETL